MTRINLVDLMEVDRRFLARDKSKEPRGRTGKFIVVRGSDPLPVLTPKEMRQREDLLELQRSVDAKHWPRIQRVAADQ